MHKESGRIYSPEELRIRGVTPDDLTRLVEIPAQSPFGRPTLGAQPSRSRTGITSRAAGSSSSASWGALRSRPSSGTKSASSYARSPGF